jgi:hypothetical protein
LWTNPDNWDNCDTQSGHPVANDKVLIPSGRPRYPIISWGSSVNNARAVLAFAEGPGGGSISATGSLSPWNTASLAIISGKIGSSVNFDQIVLRSPTGEFDIYNNAHVRVTQSNGAEDRSMLEVRTIHVGNGTSGGTFEVVNASFEQNIRTKLVLNGSSSNPATLRLDGSVFHNASHTENSIELVNNWNIAQFDNVTFGAESVSYVEGEITKFRNKESTFVKALGCANSVISDTTWSNIKFNFTNGATYAPDLGRSLDFSACNIMVAPSRVTISGPSTVDMVNSLSPAGLFHWVP